MVSHFLENVFLQQRNLSLTRQCLGYIRSDMDVSRRFQLKFGIGLRTPQTSPLGNIYLASKPTAYSTSHGIRIRVLDSFLSQRT